MSTDTVQISNQSKPLHALVVVCNVRSILLDTNLNCDSDICRQKQHSRVRKYEIDIKCFRVGCGGTMSILRPVAISW
jgi:hypothetical protein